jgi:hypothetical protein
VEFRSWVFPAVLHQTWIRTSRDLRRRILESLPTPRREGAVGHHDEIRTEVQGKKEASGGKKDGGVMKASRMLKEEVD